MAHKTRLLLHLVPIWHILAYLGDVCLIMAYLGNICLHFRVINNSTNFARLRELKESMLCVCADITVAVNKVFFFADMKRQSFESIRTHACLYTCTHTAQLSCVMINVELANTQ
jgi:hypothetical protein